MIFSAGFIPEIGERVIAAHFHSPQPEVPKSKFAGAFQPVIKRKSRVCTGSNSAASGILFP
jgi:hypothetical protein